VELDLSHLKGHTPVEMIGQTLFPTIGDAPYFLTLGPHNFFWFHLTQVPEVPRTPLELVFPEAEESLPVLNFAAPGNEFVTRNARIMENQVLPPYLRKQPWFSGPYRKIQNVLIKDWIMDEAGVPLLILFVEVKFARGPGETYVLPLCIRQNSGTEPDQPLARIRGLETEFVLSEALADEVGACRFLDWLRTSSKFQTQQGEINLKLFEAENIDEAFRIEDAHHDRFQIAATHSDRTVSTFGARLLLKLYRRLEEGPSPEQEALKHLATVKFDRVLRILAALEYKQNAEASTILIDERLVSHQGNAWDYTLDELGRYYERALIARNEILAASEDASMFSLISEKPSHHLVDVIGDYLQTAAQLGRRTAELHLALAQESDDPNFQAQIMKTSDYDELVKQLKSHSEEAFEELKTAYKKLSRGARERAQIILRSRKDLISQFEDLRKWKVPLQKIRVHGSYDLGKLLWIKNDFLIMDFEGEWGKTLEERRKLHSPLKDVAFMLRSFRYAAYTALNQFTETRRQAYNQLEAWANCWQRWVSAEFMREYRIIIARSPLVPRRMIDFEKLTKLYLADKTLSELEYELAQRPDWIKIPLNGLLELGVSVEKA
jgi:maltose alpha-D-glucosyltransferase/alpha-amylase